MDIVSVRAQPQLAGQAVRYFQASWPGVDPMVYEDSITSSLGASAPLPQWYLLCDGHSIAGCMGLITNDFISRMDLWPWLCALYVAPQYRGRGCGALLVHHAKREAKQLGYKALYLCTDHTGYYERHGFAFFAMGYHPWGESSRIYQAEL